jgi:hypothetical protein
MADDASLDELLAKIIRIGEKRRYGGNDHYRVREQPCPGEQARAIATTLSGLEEVQLRGSIQA